MTTIRPRRWLRFLPTMLALSCSIPSIASGQCDDWIYTPGFHAPFRAVGARALTLYTPPGGTTPRVILGGQDLYLNGTDIGGIAQWDGTAWSSLGQGVDFTVMDTLVWNSPTGQVLVAGGNFRNAGGLPASYLAAWNGSAWSQIGGGVHQSSGGWVAAMTVWDPDGTGPQPPNLVVAGDFDMAGTVACQNIARWDGTTWRTFGIGLNNWVDALTTWDPDGPGPAFPHLIAAGHFTVANNTIVNHIARWDGAGWRRLGDGLTNDPNRASYADALTTWDPDGPGPLNSEVVVVGGFSHADTVEAHGIAAWNGTSWRSFNTPQFTSPSGVGTWDPDASGPQFPQLVVSGNVLDDAGQTRIDTPAIWNGTTFQTIGTFADTRWAYRFATWDPDNAGPLAPRLVAAGLIGGNLPTGAGQGIIQLVNNEWTTFGATPNILAATTFGNRAVVGGAFQMIAANPADPFSPLVAFNLAAWDGAEVTTFGNVSGTVRALKSFTNSTLFPPQRDLYVAGTIGGVASPGATGFVVNNIARYSENSRGRDGNIAPPGWFTMGDGFNCSVHALERFNSATYAAGCFTMSGTTAVNRVARFNGTLWQPLGTGIANGTVFALCTYNGSLYAGGSFTIAGGITTGGLARWNGTAWSAVGGSFSGTVLALAVYNNELYIGGQFGGAITKFNGTSFSALGAGGANGPVRALAVGADGFLYLGGDFTVILGTFAADRVARWNGTSLSAVRGGLNGPVQALQSFRNEIHAGGTFGKARNAEMAAPAWGRYTVDGIPWIARQPSATIDCTPSFSDGRELFISVSPASGYFPLTAVWRHNGVPITSGLRPWGSNVTLAYAYGLRIENARGPDSGTYDCVITHEGCGSVTTNSTVVTICAADIDDGSGTGRCDGGVTVEDLLYFLDIFEQGLLAADVDDGSSTGTPDNGVTIDDLLYFLIRFVEGC